MFETTGVHVLGIIENMSGPVFGRGGAKAWAAATGHRFLGEVPLVPEIRVSGDEGKPAVLNADPKVSGPFKAICAELVKAVDARNAEAPTQPPISIARPG
jgi:ATP-binding protein involved in chromosome partitioning